MAGTGPSAWVSLEDKHCQVSTWIGSTRGARQRARVSLTGVFRTLLSHIYILNILEITILWYFKISDFHPFFTKHIPNFYTVLYL